MDVLTNKSIKQYNYVSRYASFPYYYNMVDGKYMYGTTSHLNDGISYVAHKVEQHDTLDSISEKYYGRPDLYWVIADFNRISDPFDALWGNRVSINVPTLSNISFRRS